MVLNASCATSTLQGPTETTSGRRPPREVLASRLSRAPDRHCVKLSVKCPVMDHALQSGQNIQYSTETPLEVSIYLIYAYIKPSVPSQFDANADTTLGKSAYIRSPLGRRIIGTLRYQNGVTSVSLIQTILSFRRPFTQRQCTDKCTNIIQICISRRWPPAQTIDRHDFFYPSSSMNSS